MYKLASSFRQVSPETTLRTIRIDAARVGVTRVTDITHLDRIGIPAYSSVRIDADDFSLHVHNGKGLCNVDAEVGAYAEAVEFALADPLRAHIHLSELTPRQIVNQKGHYWPFVAYCPLLKSSVDADKPIKVALMKILGKEDTVFVPAELVLHPGIKGELVIFGTSTNGLASGNTIEEAILHALCEVLERDLRTMSKAENSAKVVDLSTIPEDFKATQLINKIHDSGLNLVVRTVKNDYGVTYFEAYIIDPCIENPISLSFGSSAHIDTDIALVRAISEAAQSRLTYIQGGRDDIEDRYEYYLKNGKCAEIDDVESVVNNLTTSNSDMATCPINSNKINSIHDALSYLSNKISEIDGVGPILWCDLSNSRIHLKVVRVVIPGMEFHKHDFERVGLRLCEALGA